jgi:2'-5' RNA ligase
VICIRAFIGIDLDPECKKYIFDLQQRLRKYAVRGRWKHSSNFHLTLKFLDEISPARKELIDARLHEICKAQKTFSLEVSEAGIFRGRDVIRVLWLGLGGSLDTLRQLAAGIDESVSGLGFPLERRPFTPHITIGQDIIFQCPFDEIKDAVGRISYGPMEVKTVNLFKSEQLQNKRIYTKISNYPLDGGSL